MRIKKASLHLRHSDAMMFWQSFPAAILGFRSLQVCRKRAAQLILQPNVMSNFAQVDDASGSEIDTSSFQTKPSSRKRLGFAKIIHKSWSAIFVSTPAPHHHRHHHHHHHHHHQYPYNIYLAYLIDLIYLVYLIHLICLICLILFPKSISDAWVLV